MGGNEVPLICVLWPIYGILIQYSFASLFFQFFMPKLCCTSEIQLNKWQMNTGNFCFLSPGCLRVGATHLLHIFFLIKFIVFFYKVSLFQDCVITTPKKLTLVTNVHWSWWVLHLNKWLMHSISTLQRGEHRHWVPLHTSKWRFN